MLRLGRRTQHATVLSVAALLILTAAGPVRAQNGSDDRVGATECCLPLLFSVGARAVALGNALTARSGADALHVNPAALARVGRDEFRIHNAKTEIETSNTFGVAFRIRSAGTVGLSYRLVDYGEVTATDPSGNPTGQIRLLDQVLLASFATTLGGGVTAGVSYKLFQFRQDCSGFCGVQGFAATTHGIDFGVQYHPPLWQALQLGASIVHLGLPLQVINAEQASPTPGRVRVGAGYEALHHFTSDSTTALWASVDLAGSWRQGVPLVASMGLELSMAETIFVRTGYSTGSGRNAGAAVGVGLKYDRFDVGIAKSFVAASTGQDPFQITFAIGF